MIQKQVAEIMEIELKTIFTECELNKFLQSNFFTERVEKGSEQVLQLTSVYYDTPDFALQKQGSVYRVRTTQFADGKKEFESTTKRTVKKNGGVAEREEINEPQENALPKLPDVQEIFRTEVIRKIYYLEHGQALFEMAIDRGKIVAVNGRTETIDEVEFEVKTGGVEDLENLRQALHQVANFQEEEKSKYARGMALLR